MSKRLRKAEKKFQQDGQLRSKSNNSGVHTSNPVSSSYRHSRSRQLRVPMMLAVRSQPASSRIPASPIKNRKQTENC